MGLRAAVVGASGYAGGELLRLLVGHPDIEPAALVAATRAGSPVLDAHPHLPALAGRTFAALGDTDLAAYDVVFLALPHGESGAVAAALPADPAQRPAQGPVVVDLGADHRLADAGAWASGYRTPYAGHWPYGLPELAGGRELIATVRRVAAPGCYPTAVALALAPLLAAGLVEPADVVVVAASGTSGAGRTPTVGLLGAEVMGALSAYKVGEHQHVAEMRQATGATSLSFTPVLAPLPRGILATVTARPVGALSTDDVREVLSAAYGDEPFVHLLPEGRWPHTGATLGSNACHLQATVDRDSGRVVVVSAIDNLGKGAAGQAVQCANLMLGLPEAAGLTAAGVAP